MDRPVCTALVTRGEGWPPGDTLLMSISDLNMWIAYHDTVQGGWLNVNVNAEYSCSPVLFIFYLQWPPLPPWAESYTLPCTHPPRCSPSWRLYSPCHPPSGVEPCTPAVHSPFPVLSILEAVLTVSPSLWDGTLHPCCALTLPGALHPRGCIDCVTLPLGWNPAPLLCTHPPRCSPS